MNKVSLFELHQLECDKRKLVDIANTKSLISCCNFAAPLLRDYLHELAKPKELANLKRLKNQFEEKKYKATKAKLKASMVYK